MVKMKRMKFATLFSDDAGMTTAEYAVGTVAAAGLGGVLVKMLSSTEVQTMLWSIIEHALDVFLG